MLRLKFLLWMLGRLLKKAYKSQPEMRSKLEKEPLNFVIKTRDWPGRSFRLQPQQVSSQAGDLEQADMKLVFQSAQEAWKTLTSKDKNAFMKAIQDGEVRIEGDPKKLFQLQGLMKYLKV